MDSQKEMSKVLRIAGGGSSIVIGPHNPAPAAGPCTAAACHRSNDTNYGVQCPAQPAQPSPAQPSTHIMLLVLGIFTTLISE